MLGYTKSPVLVSATAFVRIGELEMPRDITSVPVQSEGLSE